MFFFFKLRDHAKKTPLNTKELKAFLINERISFRSLLFLSNFVFAYSITVAAATSISFDYDFHENERDNKNLFALIYHTMLFQALYIICVPLLYEVTFRRLYWANEQADFLSLYKRIRCVSCDSDVDSK